MANQTYRAVITGNCCGQFVQNILHYRMDDDSFTNRLLAAKGLIDGWHAAGRLGTWLEFHPSEYIYLSIKARRITNGGGPEYIDVTDTGETGQNGSDAQISGAGPVIIWNTDGGPRRIGKTFISGIGIGNVDGGEITAAAIAAFASTANTFRAPFNAVGGATPVCTLCIPRSNDPSTRSLIVGEQISKMIGQQRRRQLPV